jgi:nucleoside-triphosphatase THEP1
MNQPSGSLLTGPPGFGKTTAVCRLVGRLPDLRLAGFYTRRYARAGSG